MEQKQETGGPKFARSNGYRIAYEVIGPELGPPVIFLHGVGSDRTAWYGQLAAASARGYRAITLEYRGHGQSDLPADPEKEISRESFAQDALSVMRAEGSEAAHWVGLSLGGVIGLQLWQDEPQAVLSLALADSFAAMPDREAALARRLADIDRLSMREMAETRVQALFGPEADQAVVKDVTERMAAKHKPSYRQSNIATWGPDFRAILKRVAVPTLVMAGEFDRITPPALSEELAQNIPGARLEIIGGAGHLSNLDRPEIFNRLVLDFVDEVERKRGP